MYSSKIQYDVDDAVDDDYEPSFQLLQILIRPPIITMK